MFPGTNSGQFSEENEIYELEIEAESNKQLYVETSLLILKVILKSQIVIFHSATASFFSETQSTPACPYI
jgi:hypothetical protein